MASLFERLNKERPPQQIEKAIKQSHKNVDLKTLLKDILVNGPVPTTLVEERSAAHGFTNKQIRYARQQMNIVAFKETGRLHGRWFLALPYDMRGIPVQQITPKTSHF